MTIRMSEPKVVLLHEFFRTRLPAGRLHELTLRADLPRLIKFVYPDSYQDELIRVMSVAVHISGQSFDSNSKGVFDAAPDASPSSFNT